MRICWVVTKNDIAVKDAFICFVSIACLLGSIKKKNSAVSDEIACYVCDYAEKLGEWVGAVQKKFKVAHLKWTIKNECSIRDFEASTFPKVKKKLHCSLVTMWLKRKGTYIKHSCEQTM